MFQSCELMNSESNLQITELQVKTKMSVFGCSLRDHPEELSLALQAVEELRQQHPETTPSNIVGQYMSPWKSHLLNDKLNPILTLVASKINQASKRFLNVDLRQLNYQLVIADCWCAVYEKSNYTIPHSHFPSDFSAVIYLELESDSAPIIFDNDVAVKPSVGSVVFFPGALVHHVPATEGRRVIVAVNYIKIPVM